MKTFEQSCRISVCLQ